MHRVRAPRWRRSTSGKSACSGLPLIACTSKPARLKMSTASEPTPPVAPVTASGPSSGVCRLSSMRNKASAAVNPAVPRIMLSRRLRPCGSGIAHCASIRAYSRVAAVAGFAEAAAGDQHRVAFLELRVGRSDDVPGDVDAADQRERAQDLALAGAGQRVLEVDRGVRGLDDDFAGGEVVDRDILDAGCGSHRSGACCRCGCGRRGSGSGIVMLGSSFWSKVENAVLRWPGSAATATMLAQILAALLVQPLR